MKKVILLFSIVISAQAYSQQDPAFSGEGFTPYYTNPASYGSWNRFSVQTVGRLQWVGVSGAPRTLQLHVEGGGLGFRKKGVKERIFEFSAGINFMAEEIGFQRNQSLKIPLVVPVRIGETQLALGVAPGVSRLAFAPTWIPPQTLLDSLLPTATSGVVFDLDAGLFWYNENFFVGLSATHITRPGYGSINYSTAVHYYLHGGYKFKIGEHYLFPTAQIRAAGGFGSWDIFNYFQFKERFAVGLGYRASDAIMIGGWIEFYHVRVGYHYDYTINPLSTYSSGSHEVRLSYIIGKNEKLPLNSE